MVRNLPAMWKTSVQSRGQKDLLEKRMASLQCSCLENSADRGPRWAIVHSIAKSQTRLSGKYFHKLLTFTYIVYTYSVY